MNVAIDLSGHAGRVSNQGLSHKEFFGIFVIPLSLRAT